MIRSSLIILFLTFSASAGAQGFDYNFLQLNYSNIDFDDINVDGDGLGLSGSYAINPDWHVVASFQSAGLDFGVDLIQFGAGFGYNTELSETVDAFAQFSYQYIDFDTPGGGGGDDSGLGFDVGLRFAASPEVEIDAGFSYVDFGDGGDDTAFSLGGLYEFTDAFSLGLSGSFSDDVSSFTLSGRFYFGK